MEQLNHLIYRHRNVAKKKNLRASNQCEIYSQYKCIQCTHLRLEMLDIQYDVEYFSSFGFPMFVCCRMPRT